MNKHRHILRLAGLELTTPGLAHPTLNSKFTGIGWKYVYIKLENCPSRMNGKFKVVLKQHILLKSVTKQHTKIKIITYLCLITKAAKC
jgi:hypothetical protein